jgi:hypothetical protein
MRLLSLVSRRTGIGAPTWGYLEYRQQVCNFFSKDRRIQCFQKVTKPVILPFDIEAH